MRVLFTTTPGWGHVHPMVPLAQAFRQRGDDVHWAAAAELCPRLRDEGFSAEAAGLGLAESRREFDRRFPELEQLPAAERPAFMFPRLFGAVRAPRMLFDLLPLLRHFKPSVVVHDAGEFAASIAAATADVPSVTHSYGALTPAERVTAAADLVATLWEAQGLTPPPYAGSYEHLYLDIYPPSLQAGDTAHVPVAQLLRPVTFATPGEETLPASLETGETSPLVYVTFGTVFNKDVSLASTVVEALRDLPLRVLVTVGPHGDPALLGDQPHNVHIARYIPQTRLLPHCAAVVSHSGSGTFLAALAWGLPQLCLPQAADQFLNADACARSGAGLALLPGGVTREAVRGATDRLLSDPQIGSAAARIGQQIADMPDPNEVAEIIADRFVE